MAHYPSLPGCQRSLLPAVPEVQGSHARALDFRHPASGGGKRIRTAGPLLAKQVLFQLSYTPDPSRRRPRLPPGRLLVGLGRVELPTSPLSGVRSSQLSYRPSIATGTALSSALSSMMPRRAKAPQRRPPFRRSFARWPPCLRSLKTR
jgi:hypothetical protein